MNGRSWRTVDITVAATIGVAFGVVFWAWNQVWAATAPAFAAVPPAQAVIYGVWLVPAVLGALVVRKPGAAIFTELVAATVSALIGSQWGLDTLLSGAMQGGAAELVFLATRYRAWTWLVSAAAAAAAAGAAWVHDVVVVNYYPTFTATDLAILGALMVASATLIAGVGSWLLLRSLAATGALAAFPAGRSQTRV